VSVVVCLVDTCPDAPLLRGVVRGVVQLVQRLVLGDFFGERTLIHKTKRVVTCVAATRVVCLTVSRDKFLSVISEVGSLLGKASTIKPDTDPETRALSECVGSLWLMAGCVMVAMNPPH